MLSEGLLEFCCYFISISTSVTFCWCPAVSVMFFVCCIVCNVFLFMLLFVAVIACHVFLFILVAVLLSFVPPEGLLRSGDRVWGKQLQGNLEFQGFSRNICMYVVYIYIYDIILALLQYIYIYI